MKYYDYEWDLEPNRITLDSELDLEKLGWNSGDYFKLVKTNGQFKLVKTDVLQKFLDDGLKNEGN
jgi:hypothetical protein